MQTLLHGRYHPRVLDFCLKTTSAVTSGLTMQLVPTGPQLPTMDDSIWIDEEPFCYLEGCIIKCWPTYATYGHWGVITIPVSMWREIATLLTALRESLLAANSPDAVTGIFFMFAHSHTRFSRTFVSVRPALARLTSDLLKWLELRFDSCSDIIIGGI